MKIRMTVISMMLALAATLSGCATSGDLQKMQAQQKLIDAKADQALQDAQSAKAAADAAKTRADEAEKRATERERIADEKAARADAVFQKSMKK
ncbi:Lpp/OprI family alanine-zipper lipoprotein [Pelotalea chapellei]|uniref:Murein lipoprotein n=1 Tax=Pelotalea chapellei TaxID=44671 RepID=A0ABS5UD02_9BACT|nr:Lpp/OprI family alanine-zipper lipoprotein [Pelotalea chapellei]MBT1073521.1 hypothetical protein [Pelotalea chapellei]